MNKNKYLFQFCLIALVCYMGWFVLYDLWLGPQGKVDFMLTNTIARQSCSLLNHLGYNVHQVTVFSKHYIFIGTEKIFKIADACNGLVLYPLFAGFIFAAPGKWKKKLAVILAGSVAIYMVNIVRIVLLFLVQLYAPAYLHFNHKYTFTVLVYGFIFSLWMLYINRYSDLYKVAGEKH